MSAEDLEAFAKPRHRAYSQGAVERDVRPKLAALRAEGLLPHDVGVLLAQRNSPLACSYSTVFQPNVGYLRSLLSEVEFVRKPSEPPGLTRLGRLLRNQPAALGQLLSTSPASILKLEAWVCGELGLTRVQLGQGAFVSPRILYLSLDNAKAVAGYLEGELGMPRDQVVRQLLRAPRTFGTTPAMLQDKVAGAIGKLGLEGPAAYVQLLESFPGLILQQLPELEGLLLELDALFGKHQAGLGLILREPRVAAVGAKRLRKNVEFLQGMGLSLAEVAEFFERDPVRAVLDLGSAIQLQKVAWGERELGWPFAKILGEGYFKLTLRRMASRLDFIRELGLPDPGSLSMIGRHAEPAFLAWVSKRAGREVGAAEFKAWARRWLETGRGREYGFKPLDQVGNLDS